MATFTGTAANETITPTTVSGTVTRVPAGSFPSDAADTIDAGAGNDYLDSGGGNDQVKGELGNDTIYGGFGDDLLDGDRILSLFPYEEGGNDTLYGGGGNDTLLGRAGADKLYGGEGNDEIYGDDAGYPGGADDLIDGGGGNDTIYGAYGNDRIYGGDGNDTIHGDVSNFLDFNISADWLDGGTGDDVILEGAATTSSTAGKATTRSEAFTLGLGSSAAARSTGEAGTIRCGWMRRGFPPAIGGPGNDSYVIWSAGDAVIEANGEGTDTVFGWGSGLVPYDPDTGSMASARTRCRRTSRTWIWGALESSRTMDNTCRWGTCVSTAPATGSTT